MAPGDIGEVGRRGHPPGLRTLPEQPPVFGLEAHVHPCIAVHLVRRRHRGWVIKASGPEHDIKQLPKQCRFRDPVAFSESSDAGFRLRRHATGDEGNRFTTATTKQAWSWVYCEFETRIGCVRAFAITSRS